MATKKTPDYKRIARAENSSNEWKLKAIERREENEFLKERLKIFESKLSDLSDKTIEMRDKASALEKEVISLRKHLEAADQLVVKQNEEIAILKKRLRC